MENQIHTIILTIANRIPELQRCNLFIFGSRARGDNAKTSDIDIGIDSHEKIAKTTLVTFKNALSESNIPYMYDIVDFTRASKSFVAEARKNIIHLSHATHA